MEKINCPGESGPEVESPQFTFSQKSELNFVSQFREKEGPLT